MHCFKSAHLTGMGAVIRSMGQGSVLASNLSMVRCTNAGRPHESCWRKGTLGEVRVSRRVCRHRRHSHLHKPNELPPGQKRGSQAPRWTLDPQHIFTPRQHCGYKHYVQISSKDNGYKKMELSEKDSNKLLQLSPGGTATCEKRCAFPAAANAIPKVSLSPQRYLRFSRAKLPHNVHKIKKKKS